MAAITDAPPPTDTPAPPAPVEDWRAGLPDDLRADKSLEAIKGKDWTEAGPVLAKNYIETKKLVGAKTDGMVKVPGKDAKPEDIAAFNKAIGVPEAHDKYDFSALGDYNKERAADVTPIFHKAGLTNEQAVKIAHEFQQVQERWLAHENESYLQAHDTMAGEMGELAYNRHVQNVQRLVRQYFDEDTRAWLDRTKAANHPGLFKGFMALAQHFKEGRLPGGEPEGGRTVEDVDKKISETRDAMLKLAEGSTEWKGHFDKLEELWKLRADMLGAKS